MGLRFWFLAGLVLAEIKWSVRKRERIEQSKWLCSTLDRERERERESKRGKEEKGDTLSEREGGEERACVLSEIS